MCYLEAVVTKLVGSSNLMKRRYMFLVEASFTLMSYFSFSSVSIKDSLTKS